MAASSSCENCSFSIANSHTQIELSRDSFACLLVYSSSSACCCESVAIFERKYEHLLFLLSKVYVFPLFDAFSNTAFAVVTCEVERNKKKTSLLPPLSSDSIFRTPGKNEASIIHFVIINYLECEHFLSASTTGHDKKFRHHKPGGGGEWKENTNSAFWMNVDGVMKWRDIVAIFQIPTFYRARCKLLRSSSGGAFYVCWWREYLLLLQPFPQRCPRARYAKSIKTSFQRYFRCFFAFPAARRESRMRAIFQHSLMWLLLVLRAPS